MLKRINIRQEIVLVALLMLVFIVVTAYGVYREHRERNPAEIIPACSESTHGDGFLALYRLLESSGFEPGRWKRSSFNLPPTPFVFIVGNPNFPSYNKEEAMALLEWVAAGNTLFLIGEPGDELCKKMGIKIEDLKNSVPKGFKKHDEKKEAPPDTDDPASLFESSSYYDELYDIPPSLVSGSTKGIAAVTFGNRAFITRTNPSAMPVFGGPENFNTIFLPWKKGKIILMADALPFINRNIDKADNALFILQALRGWGEMDRVLFDEYHHGMQARDTMLGVLVQTPIGWGIIQAILGVLLVLVGIGSRFGKPREEKSPDRDRRGRGEYVRSMAALLHKRNAAPMILEEMTKNFREEIVWCLGMPPGTPLREALSATVKDGAIPGALVDELHKILDVKPSAGALTDKELLHAANLMEKILKPLRRKT